MKQALVILTVALTVAAFLGCRPEVRAPVVGRNDPHDRQQIHFNDDEIRRDTAVGAPIVKRDLNGLLYITVPVRSAINKTLYVDYRVTFFDKTSQVLSQTGWFTKTLEANTPDQITVNSYDKQAEQFQVDFRYAR